MREAEAKLTNRERMAFVSQLATIAKNELDVVRWLIVLIQFWNANAVIEDGQGELVIFDGKRQQQVSRTSRSTPMNDTKFVASLRMSKGSFEKAALLTDLCW